MGIEDKQKMMSKPREGGKPRWRYHWGNYVPEGLVLEETEVLFRDWVKGRYIIGLGPHFLHEGPSDTHIVAYRIK